MARSHHGWTIRDEQTKGAEYIVLGLYIQSNRGVEGRSRPAINL
ncbi:hypothetical protein PN441_00720 [Spirulina major CS-329]|nr:MULTISPECIES: hypothetical protein [Spirulina]MDB9494449.1 hypothetical protein [Spirulina subsalsa CS-330]MDB9501576.1 hypothetical protein [Spirulina major CS-329]